MKLLFTGAQKEGDLQAEPRLSLGNYVSGSPVPNGSLNNLFGEISQYSLEKAITEYRAVALQNTTGSVVSTAKVYYENLSTNPLTNIRMAIVILAQNDCGWYMERVANVSAKPLNAIFVDSRSILNAIDLPAINPNEYIGIWIERSFNKDAVETALACETLLNAFEATPTDQVSCIETVADVAGSLHEKYFLLDTIDNKFFLWIDSGGGTIPNVPNREPIKVTININDTAASVASAISNQINAILSPRGEVSSEVALNKVTITNTAPGLTPVPDPQLTGFTTSILTPGSAGDLEKIEDIGLTIDW